MLKRFLALAIALTMIVSVGFALAGCGNAYPDEAPADAPLDGALDGDWRGGGSILGGMLRFQGSDFSFYAVHHMANQDSAGYIGPSFSGTFSVMDDQIEFVLDDGEIIVLQLSRTANTLTLTRGPHAAASHNAANLTGPFQRQ